MELVTIDGSKLEGGGQIFRNAITLSALKKIPVKIFNIRAGRPKGGLMEQHLKGLELIQNMCNAKVKGAFLGSTEVEFYPGLLKGGTFTSFAKTAGSVCLLLQVALPCALFADSPVTLTLGGGTNCEMAPQIDYITEVFRPILEKFGGTFDFELIKRGYFPKGGGEVRIDVKPVSELRGINLTKQGNITTIYGWSFVAGVLPVVLAHRMATGAIEALKPVYANVNIERYKESAEMAPDNCAGIVLVAETDTKCFIGGSALGKRDLMSEETGKKAAEEIITAIHEGACVDKHCQDQIIILMAIAKGESRIRVGEITLHTRTSIFVAETLTNAKFVIIPDGSSNIIHCMGNT